MFFFDFYENSLIITKKISKQNHLSICDRIRPLGSHLVNHKEFDNLKKDEKIMSGRLFEGGCQQSLCCPENGTNLNY